MLWCCNDGLPSLRKRSFMPHGFRKTKAIFVKNGVARGWCIFDQAAFFLRHHGARVRPAGARARGLFFLGIRTRRTHAACAVRSVRAFERRRCAQLVHARPAASRPAVGHCARVAQNLARARALGCPAGMENNAECQPRPSTLPRHRRPIPDRPVAVRLTSTGWVRTFLRLARRPTAQVAELVDALVSGTSGAIRGGSSPLLGTSTPCAPLRRGSPSIVQDRRRCRDARRQLPWAAQRVAKNCIPPVMRI